MKNRLSLKIIILSILFILISISAITIYNIYTLTNNYETQIKRVTEEFISNKKGLIESRVKYITENIDVYSLEIENSLKQRIKTKVEDALHVTNFMYKKSSKLHNENETKKSILNFLANTKFDSKDSYIFVIDLNTNRVLLNKQQYFVNKDLSFFKTKDGRNILKEEKALLNKQKSGFLKIKFPKPTITNKEFDKLIYITKFEKYNWLIGTGEYLDEMKKEVQKRVLKSINILDSIYNPYIFVMQLDNLEGIGTYGKVVLHQMKPALVGNKLIIPENNIEQKNYRNSYLKVLKEKGQGYVTYRYEKPKSKEIRSKISFMYYYKNWKWAIGSGFYFDDLEKDISLIKENLSKQKNSYIKTALTVSFLIFIVLSFLYYFISKKIALTIKEYSLKLEKANNLLQKERDMFYKLFEKSEDGILILSSEGNILNCNTSIVRMLGYNNNSDLLDKEITFISKKIQENKIKSSSLFKRLSLECINKGTSSHEWMYKRKDGSTLWTDIRTTRMKIDNKLVIHSVIRDIGDKKRLIEKSNKQHILLAQKSKKMAMGDMLENIAHQWRQPLNNVFLLVQLLRDKIKIKDIKSSEMNEIVDDCKLQITYMTNTIDTFTNFIQPTIKKDNYNLVDIINKTLHIVKAHFETKRINIIVNSLPIKLYTIENSLIQVILNILNNAKDELVKLNTKRNIFIDTYEKENEVIILIKDNAGGIEEKNLGRIFEPYFTTKKSTKGTGIGLYIAEEIIQKELTGSISAKNSTYKYNNEKYEGCLFKIKLNK